MHLFIVIFSSHCTAFHFLSCIVSFCGTLHYCLLTFLNISLLATRSVELNLNLNARAQSMASRIRNLIDIC